MTWIVASHRPRTIHVTHPMLEGMLNVVASAHGGELPREFWHYREWA
jgi:hypothetical protein